MGVWKAARRPLLIFDGAGLLWVCGPVLVKHVSPALDRARAYDVQQAPVHVTSWSGLQLVLPVLETRVGHELALFAHDTIWRQAGTEAALGGVLVGIVCLMIGARGPSPREKAHRERVEKERDRARAKAEAQGLPTTKDGRPLPSGKAAGPVVAPEDDLRAEGWIGAASSAGAWPLGHDLASGKPLVLPRARQTEHVLVIGGTGSGKSSALLLRWIYAEADRRDAKARASLIVVDPKAGGELTELTIGYLSAHGYRVLVYDPMSAGTLRFNVLARCRTSSAVKGVVTQWVECLSGTESTYWRQVTVALIAGAALYLRAEAGRNWASVSLADVAAWYRDHTIEEATELLEQAAARRDADAVIRDIAGQMTSLAATPATRGGAMSGLRLRLECLTDQRVARSMAANDMDDTFWRSFVDTPTVLYVPITMQDASAIRPVVVTFLSAAVHALDRVAGPGARPLARPVRIIVDEFRNLGRVAGIERIASTARFRNIGLALATQSPTDIQALYGRSASVLLDNLLTHIVLSKSSPAALKRYCVPAFNLDVPTLMERDTALVQRAGALPVRVRTEGWYRTKTLADAVAETRVALTKAGALAHQAQILGGQPATGTVIDAEDEMVTDMMVGAPTLDDAVAGPQTHLLMEAPHAREEEDEHATGDDLLHIWAARDDSTREGESDGDGDERDRREHDDPEGYHRDDGHEGPGGALLEDDDQLLAAWG